jgi:hypothetical protein
MVSPIKGFVGFSPVFEEFLAVEVILPVEIDVFCQSF